MYAPLDQWSCTNEMLFWYLIFAIFNLNCVGVPCFTLLRIAWRPLVFVISSLKCAGLLIYNLVHDSHVLSFTNSIKNKTILSSWNTYLGFLFPSYIYFLFLRGHTRVSEDKHFLLRLTRSRSWTYPSLVCSQGSTLPAKISIILIYLKSYPFSWSINSFELLISNFTQALFSCLLSISHTVLLPFHFLRRLIAFIGSSSCLFLVSLDTERAVLSFILEIFMWRTWIFM